MKKVIMETIVRKMIEGLVMATLSAVVLVSPQSALATCGHTYDVSTDCTNNNCCDEVDMRERICRVSRRDQGETSLRWLPTASPA